MSFFGVALTVGGREVEAEAEADEDAVIDALLEETDANAEGGRSSFFLRLETETSIQTENPGKSQTNA